MYAETVVASLLHLYLKFVVLTARFGIRCDHPESVRLLREAKPVVFIFWDRFFLMLTKFLRSRNIQVLLTPKPNLALFQDLAQKQKLKFSISSVESGGRHAILELLDALKKLESVAIPMNSFHSEGDQSLRTTGMIIAQTAKVPIIPISSLSMRTFPLRVGGTVLRVPLPFQSIKVNIGQAWQVDEESQKDAYSALKENLKKELNQLCES